jgi:predicted DNA-binding transcriptional regulator YafY
MDDEPEHLLLDEPEIDEHDSEFSDEGEDGTPLEAIFNAIEDETDVRIAYAGADGVTRRTITPIEIKGAQVHALCHTSADEQRFWIPSILVAVPAHD